MTHYFHLRKKYFCTSLCESFFDISKSDYYCDILQCFYGKLKLYFFSLSKKMNDVKLKLGANNDWFIGALIMKNKLKRMSISNENNKCLDTFSTSK